MRLTIGDNWCVLEADRGVLAGLATYLSYNNHIYNFERLKGREFNEDSSDDLDEMLHTTKRERYQNWLAYRSTGKCWNPVARNSDGGYGLAFHPNNVHDGWVSVVERAGKKARFRTGLLEKVADYLGEVEVEDRTLSKKSSRHQQK